jgi:hypothetical protein
LKTSLAKNVSISWRSLIEESRCPCISNFVITPSTDLRTAWLSTDRKRWCHRLDNAYLSHNSKFSSPSCKNKQHYSQVRCHMRITNSMTYGIWRFNATFTRPLQQSLFCAKSTQFLVLIPISL